MGRRSQEAMPAVRHELSHECGAKLFAIKTGGNGNMKTTRKSQPESIRGTWPVAYKWMATGTLVVCTALGTRTIQIAEAREFRNPRQNNYPSAQEQKQSEPVLRFDIPPGSLDEVVDIFKTITGLTVQVRANAILTLPSHGVSGDFTSHRALEKLLEGTGVTSRFIDVTTVQLDLQPVSTSMEILEAPIAIASPKYAAPILETPQTIDVVPEQVMRDQGTTTLRDALRNVAGISLAAGEGSSQGDNLTIRGFTARNDIFLDGMRDFGSYYRDPFDLGEVEVLQGPSAVTFGRGTTGGVVNQESKFPRPTPFVAGTLNFGSDLTRRATVDINEPIPSLGSGTAFRLNLMGHDSKVAGRDIAQNRRFGIAPSLAFGLGSMTRLTFSYFHQTSDDIPDYGIPWLFNSPAPVARQNYYGFKDANFLRTNADVGTVKLEHEFNSNIGLRNQVRYAHYNRAFQITEAQSCNFVVTAPTPCPTAQTTPPLPTLTQLTPLNQISTFRNQLTGNSIETFLENQLDVTFRFHTGAIGHTLVTGVEGGRETSAPTRLTTYTGVPTTSELNPDTTQPYAGLPNAFTRTAVASATAGAYALDTVNLGRKWDLIGGIRWDLFDTNYAQDAYTFDAQRVPQLSTHTPFQRTDKMTSWRGAVVFKPTSNGSIYFGYGTSFNPSAESFALTAGSANLPPEKNRTFEVGSKWSLASSRLSVRGALFSTDKTNARETSPTNSLLVVLAGEQRVNGFELEAAGKLSQRWQLQSSYAYLDSKVVNSQFFPAAIGGQLANVPRNTFTFWSGYDLPWKLSVGAGGQFVDTRTASSTVPFVTVPTGLPSGSTVSLLKQVPAYWVFNAMAKYPLSERISLQVNFNNITNKYYIDQVHPNHLVPGPAFSALAGLNFRF